MSLRTLKINIKNIKSLLTYFKQIAIHKLKVEKRSIKNYLQLISMKKETTFKPIFFSHKVTMLFLLKKINNIYKVKNLKKRE